MNRNPKRRSLVLTSEQARHPFRQSLPPRVFAPFPEPEEIPRDPSMREVLLAEWKSLLSTYCAAFVVLTAFLA